MDLALKNRLRLKLIKRIDQADQMDSALKNRLRLKLIKRAAEAEQNKVRWDSTSSKKIAVMLKAPLALLWFQYCKFLNWSSPCS